METPGLAAFLVSLSTALTLEIRQEDRVLLLGNTFLEREGAHGWIETALTRRFPGRATFRNLAWSADTVFLQLRPNGYPSLEAQLEKLRPTLIFVSFAMMEALDGDAGLAPFVKAYDAYLNRLSGTKARIVLLSPIPHEAKGRPFPDPAAHNRSLGLYHEAIRTLACQRSLVFLDIHKPLLRPSVPVTENGVHPSSSGYALIARVMEEALELPPSHWNLQLEASGKVLGAVGLEISELKAERAILRFRTRGEMLPMPYDNPCQLRVTGLAAGNYALEVDGSSVLTCASDEWARGVELVRRPAHERTELLRRAIVKKNAHCFLRWRPQNAEYIHGTRSRLEGPNVGNPQFESEFQMIERVISEAEEKIAGAASLTSHLYELRRVGN